MASTNNGFGFHTKHLLNVELKFKAASCGISRAVSSTAWGSSTAACLQSGTQRMPSSIAWNLRRTASVPMNAIGGSPPSRAVGQLKANKGRRRDDSKLRALGGFQHRNGRLSGHQDFQGNQDS